MRRLSRGIVTVLLLLVAAASGIAGVAAERRGAPDAGPVLAAGRRSGVAEAAMAGESAGRHGAPRPRKVVVYLRGKAVPVKVWDPAPGAPRRPVRVLVISGDLGWLGISGDVPPHLRDEGYRVVALNAQTYEVTFTGHDRSLPADSIARDFDVIMQATNVDDRFPSTFVSVGVSEGAGLAVMAMGEPGASPDCIGVIGLGLPVHTALAWRWTDFPSWITKAEPHEPLADTEDYLVRLRVPVVVVHSIHDEYDDIAHVRAIFALVPGPKRFYPVDAPNHRFSGKTRQVLGLVDTSIDWMASLAGAAL